MRRCASRARGDRVGRTTPRRAERQSLPAAEKPWAEMPAQYYSPCIQFLDFVFLFHFLEICVSY
jgi:hypothetical protein